jgi:hypothetical protein
VLLSNTATESVYVRPIGASGMAGSKVVGGFAACCCPPPWRPHRLMFEGSRSVQLKR